MRQAAGKALFVLTFIIMGAVSFTVIALAMGAGDSRSPLKAVVYVEAGSAVPSAADFLNDTADRGADVFFTTDMSVFNAEIPPLGEYEISIMYDKKQYSAMMHLVDTVKPEGAFADRISVKGEYIEPVQFTQDITDATNVRVSYVYPVDFDKLGEQAVWVSLTDDGGNQALLGGYLYVMDGVRVRFAELGEPPGIVLTEHFLFDEGERSGAAFVTNVEELDYGKPGLIPVQIKINNRSMEQVHTFYIDVVDTTAPSAVPVPGTAYAGKPREAEAFISGITDMSETTCAFGSTPDWNKLGEQEVSIMVTDDFGNFTEVLSTLIIVEDDIPPVFTGIDEIFTAAGGTVAYRRGVSATDENDGEVEFTVDSSMVDLFTEGTYPVYYEAFDMSGNSVREVSHVVVTAVNPDEVYELAGAVLDSIIKDGMTPFEKGRAIYSWVKNNVSYASQGEKADIIAGAYNGLTKKSGDCYTFYALSTVMLDMMEIPNVPIERIGGKTRHYWSLIDVGQGWHHFDATPYREVFDGYHFTEERAKGYTSARGNNYYTYDTESLPAGVSVQ